MNLLRSMLFLLCALPLVGCGGGETGPKLYDVKGTVKFKDEPVESGEVIIESANGSGAPAGGVITGGTFEVKAPSGPKTVRITAMRDVPGKFREDNPGEKVPVREQYIPKQFNDESDLTMTVEEKSENTVEFNLTP
ncbi:hypothetical protein GC163_14510 [bacterium]|nr:hypothetical protein [bacterium]